MSDHRKPEVAAAGDSYDLALGLRRRLADAIRPETGSVASQLHSAARERLRSDERIQKGRGRSSRRRRGLTA